MVFAAKRNRVSDCEIALSKQFRLRLAAKTIVNSLQKKRKLKNNENYMAFERTVLDDNYTLRIY